LIDADGDILAIAVESNTYKKRNS